MWQPCSQQDHAAAAASSLPFRLTGVHGGGLRSEEEEEEVGRAEDGKDAGLCCGRGLEVLRGMVALWCPAALQRGWV